NVIDPPQLLVDRTKIPELRPPDIERRHVMSLCSDLCERRLCEGTADAFSDRTGSRLETLPAPPPTGSPSYLNRFRWLFPGNLLQPFVETSSVRLLSLGQRLEPLRQLVEAFGPRRLGHARVHLRVLVGLARDRRFQVLFCLSDRLAGGRVADFFQKVEVAEGVAGFGVGRVLEEARDVGKSLDVGTAREVEIPPVRLRFAGERFLQILEALSAPEACHCSSFDGWGTIDRSAGRRRSGRSTRCAVPGPRSRC